MGSRVARAEAVRGSPWMDDTRDLPDESGDGEDTIVDCVGDDDRFQVLWETTACPTYVSSRRKRRLVCDVRMPLRV